MVLADVPCIARSSKKTPPKLKLRNLWPTELQERKFNPYTGQATFLGMNKGFPFN